MTHVPRRRLIYGAARRSGGGCASVPLIARPDSAAGVTLTVNSTADGVDASPGNGVCATAGGQCTLRAAIQEANSREGDTIAFGIGGGVVTIAPTTGLPQITGPVTIDGTTQPGSTPGVTCRAETGTLRRAERHEPDDDATASSAPQRRQQRRCGLCDQRFHPGTTGGHEIRIDTAGGNTVDDNYIGTNVTGTSSVANDANGVFVFGTADNVITNNLLSGNGTNGVAITNGEGTQHGTGTESVPTPPGQRRCPMG